jgi:hypothetical protein
VKRLSSQDFPNVDPTKFAEWQHMKLKAINIFLWATWGAFFIKLAIGMVLLQIRLSQTGAVICTILILVAWFVGLFIAGVHGSEAKELRKAAGIKSLIAF